MKIKKVISTATICAGLFALTVPSSFVFAACPIHGDTVTPENAGCMECDQCTSSDGMVTGAAANMEDAEKGSKTQVYTYPESVYSHANTTFTGDERNGALVSDDSYASALRNNNDTTAASSANNGVLVQSGQITGAAAVIDSTKDIDDMIIQKNPAFSPSACDSIKVESPTSVEITKRYLESYVPSSAITGAAAGMNGKMGEFYPDVPDRFYASREINILTEKGVLVGYPDGLFKPNKNITRAEMASAVVKGYNLEGTALSNEGDFADVPESNWAYEAINKGTSSDILEGYANGTFKPHNPITMAQALTIVARGVNCPMDDQKADEILAKYLDRGQVPSWAKQSVAIAIQNGALDHSKAGNYIHPNKEATRAEVALMLQNMRVAGGYDVENKVAEEKNIKSFVEKEMKVQVPTLELTMNDMLNSKNANVGEKFAATTVNDIIIGGTLYPSGSRVNGRVMEVTRPSKNSEGAMRLSFEEIVDVNDHSQKTTLPKQVLTARVDKTEQSSWFARTIEFPFTWTGSLLGNAGRTVGGAAIALSNATENMLDSVGTGSAEILTGKFRAGGRSYQNAGKALVMAPVDITRTTFSGLAGTFQTTGDEFAYLFDASGQKISSVNPKQKITIAFGE